MTQKAVFLDIDGTMVNGEGHIPASTREAVRRAKEKGHKLVVCSGRSRFQIHDELLDLGFSGIVGAAGAFVIADGKEIYHAYIDEEHRKSSFEYLEGNRFLFCYQADDGVVLNQRSSEGILALYRETGMSEERLYRLTGRMHLTEEPWKNERNEKILYYGAPFTVEKVHADLAPYFDAVAISLDGMDEYAGEIGIGGINKATGMERYLKHVGIAREDSIAVGDGPNDLQMMEYAGIGVAMGNAREDVKARADMVTGHIDEDGLYSAFEKLGLL
ncbi:MAG: HAD family hydrolase [Roseburia sp.]|nr:HAD family hydrolase [Roseburia sp.]